MPDNAFWTKVVRQVLTNSGRKALSKRKVYERSVSSARDVSNIEEEALKAEVKSFINSASASSVFTVTSDAIFAPSAEEASREASRTLEKGNKKLQVSTAPRQEVEPPQDAHKEHPDCQQQECAGVPTAKATGKRKQTAATAPAERQQQDKPSKKANKLSREASKRLKKGKKEQDSAVPGQEAEPPQGAHKEQLDSQQQEGAGVPPARPTRKRKQTAATAPAESQQQDKRPKKAKKLGREASKSLKKGNTEQQNTNLSGQEAEISQNAHKEHADSQQQEGAEVPPARPTRRRKQTSATTPAENQQQNKQPKTAAMPAVAENGEELGWRDSKKRKDVKHGRFSSSEKNAIKEAAVELAIEKGLSETDFSWLFQTRKGQSTELTSGAWKRIAQALPHRTMPSVWACGTRLLHPFHLKKQALRLQGKWSEEELADLAALVEAKGRKWKEIGDELGRMPDACRDRYRELQTGGVESRKGKWTDEECQQLECAVNDYLRRKQTEESKVDAATLSLDDLAQEPAENLESAHKDHARLVLDDVDWVFVAERVPTRSRTQCMDKWYRRLAPSMVARGQWGSGDDRRLLTGVLRSGAEQEYAVPWKEVVPGRTAQQAKRRWRLMLKMVPNSKELDFREQLNYIVDTFAPDLRRNIAAVNMSDTNR